MTDQSAEDRAIDILEGLSQNLGEIITGPGADAAMLMYSVEAIGDLVTGAIGAVVLAVLVVLGIKTWKWGNEVSKQEEEKRVPKGQEDFTPVIVFIVILVLGFISFLFSTQLLSVASWVQVFHPEIGMVRDAVSALK